MSVQKCIYSLAIIDLQSKTYQDIFMYYTLQFFYPIDPFHLVTSLSNRSSIEKSIKSFFAFEGAD